MAPEGVVERALRGVLRDYGWRVAHDPERLRAMLCDLLGADAPEHRGLVDALVLAAEHGVPTELNDSETSGSDLEVRLESWGLSADRAEWAVSTWTAVAPGGTDPAPTTAPAPPGPSPVLDERHRGGSLAPTEPVATALPPAYALTALPPSPPASPPEAPAGPAAPWAPGSPSTPTGRWWKRWPVVATVALCALGLTGGGVAVLTHDRGHHQPGGVHRPHVPLALSPAAGTVLVTDRESTPRPLARPVAMASKNVGISLRALSDVAEVHLGKRTLGPPPGGRLIAFGLGRWACQEGRSCGPGGKVHVEVDGRRRVLEGGGPYVVAVAAGTSAADLVLTANGVTQRISLLTGRAAATNIEVLARPRHEMKINRRFDVTRTTSIPIYYVAGQPGTYHHTLNITIDGAELDFFVDGKTPHDPRHAFLFVNYWYAFAEDPNKAKERYVLENDEVTFVARDGTRYRAEDLDARPGYASQVFEVPADVQGGRFVIGGPQTIAKHSSSGTPYTVSIRQHVERIAF